MMMMLYYTPMLSNLFIDNEGDLLLYCERKTIVGRFVFPLTTVLLPFLLFSLYIVSARGSLSTASPVTSRTTALGPLRTGLADLFGSTIGLKLWLPLVFSSFCGNH